MKLKDAIKYLSTPSQIFMVLITLLAVVLILGSIIFELVRPWQIQKKNGVGGLYGLALASVGLSGASGLAWGPRVAWAA